MVGSKQAVTSLLTEHFSYTPLTLLDEIINMVNEIIYRNVSAIEEGLNNAQASTLGFDQKAAAEGRAPEKDDDGNDIYPDSRVEIENGVNQLETLLQSTVDKNFDKLEIYTLRNILSVPADLAPWVQLSHYQNLDLTHLTTSKDPSKPQPTPETLHSLRRKLTETHKLHSILLAERARNAAYISQLQSLLLSNDPSKPGLAFLTQSPAAQNMNLSLTNGSKTPLTEQTRHAVSQLPALRQLLASLRAKEEEGVKYARHGAASEERREYIEGQVRRRLEREGADLASGEGLIGKSVEGRTVAGEEVAGIEGVMRMVGRERPDGMDEP